MRDPGDVSNTGKLARVVLSNRGPLSPSEIAVEANIAIGEAQQAIAELEEAGFVRPVCGLCESREEVYTLTESGETFETPVE
ncbi:MAG: hypothetical protein ABEJ44_04065 [Halanaeroarchaeum sp.]